MNKETRIFVWSIIVIIFSAPLAFIQLNLIENGHTEWYRYLFVGFYLTVIIRNIVRISKTLE